jgi:hypothetical protein
MRTSTAMEEVRERGFEPLYASSLPILLMLEMPYPLNQGVRCETAVLYVSLLVRCSFGFCFLVSFGFFLLKQHLCSCGGAKSQGSCKFYFVNAFFFTPSHAQTRKGVLLSAFRLSVFLPSALGGLSFLHFFSSFLVLSFSSFFPSLVACLFLRPVVSACSPLAFVSLRSLLGFCSRFFLCLLFSVAPGCTRASVSKHKDKEKEQLKTREPKQRAQQRQTTKAIKKNRPHTGIN